MTTVRKLMSEAMCWLLFLDKECLETILKYTWNWDNSQNVNNPSMYTPNHIKCIVAAQKSDCLAKENSADITVLLMNFSF